MSLKLISVLKESIRVFIWTYFVLYLNLLGFSVIQIGYILSLGNLIYFIGYIISGPLIDRFTASSSLRASLLIFCASLVGLQFSSFIVILISFSLFNFAQSIGDIAVPILIESRKSRSSRIEFAIFSSFISLGDAILLSVALLSLMFMDLIKLFHYALIFFAIIFILVIPLVPKVKTTSAEVSLKALKEIPSEAKTYLILGTLQVAPIIFYWGYMSLYAKEIGGMNESLWTISIILWFIINSLAYFVIVKTGLKSWCLLLYGGIDVLLCALSLLDNTLSLMLAFALDAIATALFWPLHFEFVMVSIKEKLRGTYLGFLYAMRTLLSTVAYYVSAVIFTINPKFNIIIAAVIYFFFSILVYPIFRRILHD